MAEEQTLQEQRDAAAAVLAGLEAQIAAEQWDAEQAAETVTIAAEALAKQPACVAAGVAVTGDSGDEAWGVLDLSAVDANTVLEKLGVELLVADIARNHNGRGATATTVRLSRAKLPKGLAMIEERLAA